MPAAKESKPKVSFEAKCVICGHKERLTEAQIKTAQDIGVPFCSKCSNPMTVSSIKLGGK